MLIMLNLDLANSCSITFVELNPGSNFQRSSASMEAMETAVATLNGAVLINVAAHPWWWGYLVGVPGLVG